MIANARCATFDVFDTVLTRAVGSPEAVFLLLGRRLMREGLIECTPQAFAHIRVEAEERAHRNHGARCTLQDIYREVGAALASNPSLPPQLAAVECDVETALLRPVPALFPRIERARAAYGSVVYISDTYFSADFLQATLVEHGLWEAGDRCYVSCQWGALKATGELYAVVAREEGPGRGRFIHTGNDQGADVLASRRAGWFAQPFRSANPNRYEQILEASSHATDGSSSAFAGASRLARLHTEAQDDRRAAIRDVSAGVAAPVLTGYVLWLLQRAKALGLRRLYFLARDGQILLQIAQRLVKRLDLCLDLRYLYASRQAWNPAATFEGSANELEWIWDTTDTLTTEMVLRRANLSAEGIAAELEVAGLPHTAWRRDLTLPERQTLRQLLARDEVRAKVLVAAGRQRELLLRYFTQEGLLEDLPYGVVDLGWYGSMQKALAAVLAQAGHAAPPGFYFALYKGDIVDKVPLQREAYYFDERERTGYIDAVPNLIALMEMFCTADHGTTLGFEERHGAVHPVLQTGTNRPAMAWGLPLMQQAVTSFADNLFLDVTYLEARADVRPALTAVLTAFSRHPRPVEAAAWGAFPWEDGLGADTVRNPFARPYGALDLVKAVRAGSIRPQHRAAWIEGSLALSPAVLRTALRGAALFGRRRRALRARLRP